jgi:hypothetical protein
MQSFLPPDSKFYRVGLAKVSILLDEAKFAAEGVVTGRLVLDSNKEFYADEAKLLIKIKEILWPIWALAEPPTKLLCYKEALLSGPLYVPGGSRKELDFNIYTSTSPTTRLSVIVLEVTATLAVNWWSDLVEKRVENFMSEGVWNMLTSIKKNLMQELFPNAAIRVIVKETIKIPCKYCSTLLSTDTSICSYCGAKLSI